MSYAAPDAFGVVDGGADFHGGATLGTRADVDSEDAFEKLRSPVVLDLLLVDRFGVETFPCFWIEINEIGPLAVGRENFGVETLVRAGRGTMAHNFFDNFSPDKK